MNYLRSSTLLAVLILLIGGATAAFLMAQDEEEATIVIGKPVRSVDSIEVRKSSYCIQVPAWGFVDPCDVIDIRTEIGGKVTSVSKSVFAGSKVVKDTPLFSLDAGTYQNALAEAMAVHEQARQALAIEQGHQTIARAEWQLLEQSQWQGERNQALALREPQMRECQAEVAIAVARQAQAELDVARTRLAAPCTGVILSEDLAAGQVLESGATVLRLACTERYHITAAFPARYGLDTGADAGARVKAETVAFRVGAQQHNGTVKAVLPQIDPQTRQKQALVTFTGKDVTLGTYVELNLPGNRFKDVVVLPKEALRAEATVWRLDSAGTLDIRNVEVLADDQTNVVIGKGLDNGDRVILSHIATPLQGLPLRATTRPTTSQTAENAGEDGHP